MKRKDYENRYKIPRFGYFVVDKHGFPERNFMSLHPKKDFAEKAAKNMDTSFPGKAPHEVVKVRIVKILRKDDKNGQEQVETIYKVS